MGGMGVKSLARLRSETLGRAIDRGHVRGIGRVQQRPALVEQVVDRLRTYIIGGKFASGGELPPENALCQMLDVSRTVVREAMRILRAQGLVEVAQGKKPRVRPVDTEFAVDGLSLMLQRSHASPLDLVELRRPLESEIAAIAAERATRHQIEQMEASIEELRSARDLESRAEADLKFHTLLAEATGNPIFQLVLRTFWILQWQSRIKTLAYSSATVAVQWHERILAAVRRHDSQKARSEMIAHIEAAHQDLLEAGAQASGAGV
jgi:GntR family transcriptional repressor for pyruvate dehydrogenase complex